MSGPVVGPPYDTTPQAHTVFVSHISHLSSLFLPLPPRSPPAGAMELVAMELKQNGSYLARTLSYEVREGPEAGGRGRGGGGAGGEGEGGRGERGRMGGGRGGKAWREAGREAGRQRGCRSWVLYFDGSVQPGACWCEVAYQRTVPNPSSLSAQPPARLLPPLPRASSSRWPRCAPVTTSVTCTTARAACGSSCRRRS